MVTVLMPMTVGLTETKGYNVHTIVYMRNAYAVCTCIYVYVREAELLSGRLSLLSVW